MTETQLDTKRRLLLQGSLGVGLAALLPTSVFANWPQDAFKAEDKDGALQALLGNNAVEMSDAVDLKVPDIAENGAQVPVTVETELAGVESITILATTNQNPLIATFNIPEVALPFIATRIKMAETGDVMAVVKTANGLFANTKTVQVTVGGCGT